MLKNKVKLSWVENMLIIITLFYEGNIYIYHNEMVIKLEKY